MTIPLINNDSSIYQQSAQFQKAFQKLITHTSGKRKEIEDLKTQPSKILSLNLSKTI